MDPFSNCGSASDESVRTRPSLLDLQRKMTADADHLFAVTITLELLLVAAASPLLPASPLLGIAPQDHQYFSGAVIECKDGSKSFPRDRLNDGYCDCPDGTDEPGTSACPASKFYCINSRDTSQILFSSRVNDHICDCCDGSDEYDGSIKCPNTCKRNEIILSKSNDNGSTKVKLDYVGVRERNSSVDLEDLIHKLKGLRVVIVIELVSAVCMLCFCLFCRRIRTRRRHQLLKYYGYKLRRSIAKCITSHSTMINVWDLLKHNPKFASNTDLYPTGSMYDTKQKKVKKTTGTSASITDLTGDHVDSLGDHDEDPIERPMGNKITLKVNAKKIEALFHLIIRWIPC